MRKFLATLLISVLGLVSPALAQSTVNPLVPAQNAPLASAPVRSNFAAAASDINGLLGMHAVSSLGACSPQTQTIGADCLVEQSASVYIWYKYTGTNGYVEIGTINPSLNPPTFSSQLPPINNGHLIANCSGTSPSAPGDCAWGAFADQAIGSSNGDFPLRVSGVWGVGTVGTSGHAVPFLDSAGIIFSNPVTSGVAGSIVGGWCLANATSGNLCIVPSTGALGSSVATLPANTGTIAELNLSQVFTAAQSINTNAATLPSALSGTLLNVGQLDGTGARIQVTSFGATSVFSAVAYGGTNAVRTAVSSGTELGSFNSWAYNGSALSATAIAAFRTYAAENIASGHQGSKACISTTPIAGTTLTDSLCQQPSGGIVIGSATGGDQGAGTVNTSAGYYINGVLVSTSAAGITVGTSVVSGGSGGILFYNTPGGTLSVLAPANNGVVSFNNTGVLQAPTSLPNGIAAANMVLTTPAIGAATGTTIALGGCTLGGDALCSNGATAVTSSAGQAFAVGPNGNTNPTFSVDASTASTATGWLAKGFAAASGASLSVQSSGTNESGYINAKGSGSVNVGFASTGGVTIASGGGTTTIGGPVTAASLDTSGTIGGSICRTAAGDVLFINGANCFTSGTAGSIAIGTTAVTAATSNTLLGPGSVSGGTGTLAAVSAGVGISITSSSIAMNNSMGVNKYQVFSTAGGTGTITTPTGAAWAKFTIIGGGGGGAGSGTATGGTGVNGNPSCISASGPACTSPVYQAGGGTAGSWSSPGAGSGGGTCSGSGTFLLAVQGGDGFSQTSVGTGVDRVPGGFGGHSGLGYGEGGAAAQYTTAGNAGTGFGGGGQGGGSGVTASSFTGPGGGGGAGCVVFIQSPAATYTYAVAQTVSGGAAGTNGFTGGGGAQGLIKAEFGFN